MEVRSFFRFFWKLLETNLSQAYALKVKFWLEVLLMTLNDFMMLAPWLVSFDFFREINGWTAQHFLLMLGTVECGYSIYAFCFRGVGDLMAGCIERGELDSYLLQPRSVLLSVACSHSHPTALGELVAGLVFLVWSGMVTLSKLPLLLLCVLAVFLLFLAVGIFIGSLALYMEAVEAWGMQIMFVFDALATQPGSIFDGAAKAFLTFVFPAGILTFVSVDVILNPGISNLLTLVGVTTAFFLGSVWFFYHGLRRYESSNSFGVQG